MLLYGMYEFLWEDGEENELFHPVKIGEGMEGDYIKTGSSERVLVLRIPQIERLT